MNLQSLLMQNPLSPFIKPFTTSVPPISSNPPILLKLCFALKLSLQRFTAYQLQKVNTHNAVQSTKNTQKIQPQIIELLSSDEEVQQIHSKPIQSKIQKQAKNNFKTLQLQQKTDLSENHAQFQKDYKKEVQLQHTVLTKACLIRKQKFIKSGLKLRKQKHQRVEQKLDWTQTVTISKCPFSAQQLNSRRQALLLRRVETWSQNGQNKKQRRQIRMLKH